MSNTNQIASDLYKAISESDERKVKPYDVKATVVRKEEDNPNIVWVKIPGGIDETPVRKTNNANPGDEVMVRIANGRAWVLGNETSPATDDTVATAATQLAEGAGSMAKMASDSASEAQENAQLAYNFAVNAKTAADTAWDWADDAHTAATQAQGDATRANTAADNALTQLATVESVVNTLEWLTEHSELTTDTTPQAGKDYYIKNQDSTFTKVADTTGKNPQSEGWYEMDEAISNYVAAHLSLTDYGLNLTLDNSSYRIHIGTYTSSGDEGVYIIDGNGNVVSYFGENIRFSANTPQYIGNSNAYIVFNPLNGGSITIGGANIELGSGRTLDQVIGELDNTFIFDTTYTVSGTTASFEAHLYKGGVDVKEYLDADEEPLYPPEQFTWYLKHEGSVTQEGDYIGSGYQIDVDLEDCFYGAEVIAHFTTTEDSPLLNDNDDNLSDIDNNNLIGRTPSGDSVRVRDLTVSTTLTAADKLMIVGSEDEHLVSIQTLQDYIDAHLDKQVRFGTTTYWNSQTSLTSQADTLYIYTDYRVDGQGNAIAGIKVGDGGAYVVDLPFTDAIAAEHIADTTRHITSAEREFWNNKVRCYYTGTETLIFTTI